MEHLLSAPPGVLVDPSGEPRCAVLVLSGSSGRLEADRARRLAAHGAAAAAITYFGGPGQPPGLCEVALEAFTPVLDLLAARSEHLVVWGASKGAEAALLLAAADERIRTVIAVAPTAYVWANTGPGADRNERPWRSSWTRAGQPLPFLALVNGWEPSAAERGADGVHGVDGVAVRGWYEASLAAAGGEQVRAASIPVEQIHGQVVLAAGGDDRVWPSTRFADDITQRRASHDLTTMVLTEQNAGHRVVLPGEAAAGGVVGCCGAAAQRLTRASARVCGMPRARCCGSAHRDPRGDLRGHLRWYLRDRARPRASALSALSALEPAACRGTPTIGRLPG
ncbi:acyl-CoA thioester hydrolase/BAAT C-terminal domain-containing protein [Quadrisphaera sp. INWT6]|uniref:acyl-CoA thioester hydrolase/BAAT C-terminal domain-containing protein n=1 Tax=Quadrisphaera sp. INWT6 TaxID=2596917 RepID=UPI00189210C2|nr:acyl-CoA thioester hydrolase/BAAT C-terminal domain-containing protein [Quadrisphaera sp. INWT6]